MRRSIIVGLTVIALSTLSGIALAGNNATQRPFELTSNEWRVQESVIDCPDETPQPAFCLRFEGAGEGVATHMGNVSLTRTHVVIIDLTSGTTEATNGRWTVTAANGDQVFGTYAGTLTGFPVATIEGDFTFEGGTGRFDGARGAGDQDGFFDLINGVGEFVTSGWISY